MDNTIAGLPRWLVIAGAGVIVLALVLSRRSQPTVIGGGVDPNATALAQTVAQQEGANVAARASVFDTLITSVFGTIQTTDTNAATVASNRAATDAARAIAEDQNRTQLSIAQSNNLTQRSIARTQSQGNVWDFLGDVARGIADIF